MKIDDVVLFSVDDHVVEPPHVFEGRLAKQYADLAPKFVTPRSCRAPGSSAPARRWPTMRESDRCGRCLS